MKNACACLAIVTCSSLLTPTPVDAQAARTGPTFIVNSPGGLVFLPDVAYDNVRDRYLAVLEVSHVAIDVQLLDASGATLAPAARAHQNGLGVQNPRVAFGPDVNNGSGGYLVTWHENINQSTAQVWGRLVSSDGGPLGTAFPIGLESTGLPGTSANWLMGPAVAYATGSREFLVTWMGGYGAANDIRFMRVSPTGTLLQPTVTTITAGTIDWERDPSVAYNPHQDEFYVAYAGWVNAGNYGFVAGQRVKAGTGALVGGATPFGAFAAPLIPTVTYNAAARKYLVGFYNRTTTFQAVYGVTIRGADGAIVDGGVRLLSTYYFAYDALDIDYNASSGDYLLVTHGRNIEDAAVSIKADGTPVDNGFVLTNTPDVRPPSPQGDGNFNPRLAAGGSGRYLAVTSSKFTAVHGQFVKSSAGGPGGPTQPDTRMSLDLPLHGSTAVDRVTVAGWALDLNGGTGSGVDAVHVYATSVTAGNAYFLGVATAMERRDVEGAYGQERFRNAGFTLTGLLAPGWYDIHAYAHSVVSGTFTAVRHARVRVVAATNPRISIDTPTWSQVVGNTFAVAGWAIDLASTSGPGVDGVHMWAYPIVGGSYGTPLWFGSGTYGLSRPDVASWWGRPEFTNSGFSVTQTLPSGTYDIVVFSWSNVAGYFNNYVVVRVRIP